MKYQQIIGEDGRRRKQITKEVWENFEFFPCFNTAAAQFRTAEPIEKTSEQFNEETTRLGISQISRCPRLFFLKYPYNLLSSRLYFSQKWKQRRHDRREIIASLLTKNRQINYLRWVQVVHLRGRITFQRRDNEGIRTVGKRCEN